MEWSNPKIEHIIDEIKILVDDGSNIEYTRGALEIIASFMVGDDDMCHADKVIQLANEINLTKETISKLY
jgi:hypothetical protein